VVLVTGATGDVGSALCPALAALGATVILAGRKVPKLERLYDRVAAAGVEPAIYPIDLAGATAQHYDDLRENLAGEFEALHGVVHLAADFRGLTPLARFPADTWMQSVQVNLNAPFLITQALLGPLTAASDARVVFALDDDARVTSAYWGAYGVCKSAQRALVAIAAAELESSGIAVCGVQAPTLRGHLFGQYSMDPDAARAEPGDVVPAYVQALTATPAISGEILLA